MTTIHPLDDATVRTIGLTLLHFLWQGAAVAAAFAVASVLMRRSSPNARYVAGCAAMLLMAAMPVATFAWLERQAIPMEVSRPSTSTHVTPASPRSADFAMDLVDVPSRPAVATPHVSPATWRQTLDRSLPWCVGVWGIGVLLLSTQLFVGWTRLQYLRRRATRPAPAKWSGRLASLAQRVGVSRAVQLLECARVECPAVVGWVRPVILLPASAMSGLSVAHLESILAHELAHVRRHDYLVNLLQSAIETVLFYHPAVWWVSRRVRQERENACDDVAASVCGDRVLYADALATLEELRPTSARLALAARSGALLPRVRRLLGRPVADTTRAAWWPGAAVAVVTLATLAATLHLSRAADAPPLTSRETEPAAPAAATETPATAPATADASAILPEDLEPRQHTTTIGPGDLLSVSLRGLMGPDVETVSTKRVAADGTITLPYVGALNVQGRTEAEAQERITDAFESRKVADNLPVSVDVTESASQIFSALGDVQRGGRYAIPSGDFRLLDALATAGGLKDGVARIYVVRRPAAKEKAGRTLALSVDQIMRGDPSVNVVIRPGDVVMAAPAPRAQAAVVDVADQVVQEIAHATGRPAGRAFRGAVGVETDAFVPTGRATSQPAPAAYDGAAALSQLTAERRALDRQLDELRNTLSSNHPSVVAAERKLARLERDIAEVGAHTGEYYVSSPRSSGAFTMKGRVTVVQALIAAQYDVGRGGGQHLLIVRRDAGGDEPKNRAIGISELMLAPESAPDVRPGDLLIIRDGPPTTRPIPPAGGVYYIGGEVEQPGAYTITSPVSVLQAVIDARFDQQSGKDKFVTRMRRKGDAHEMRTWTVKELLANPNPPEHVMADDKLIVSTKPPAMQSATQPAR